MQGVWVQSIVKELGSHMPHSMAKNFKKLIKKLLVNWGAKCSLLFLENKM